MYPYRRKSYRRGATSYRSKTSYRRKAPYRAYKRKSYISRTSYRPRAGLSTRRTMGINNDANKQLLAIRYPHSNATTNPKIPDGAAMTSIGKRFHSFHTEKLSAVSNRFVVILTPCALSPLTIHEIATGGNLIQSTMTPKAVDIMTMTSDDSATVFTGKMDLSDWRMVSLGMKIRCTNNDTQDNGSWKAIRRTIDNEQTKWKPYNAGSTGANVINGMIRDDVTPLTRDMAQTPSFNSGLLKDIDKHYFMCTDISVGAHEFVKPRNEVVFGCNSTIANGPVVLNNNTTHNPTFLEAVTDNQFNEIFVVIDGEADVTTISIDVVANYEYVISENAIALKQYEDECAFAPDTWQRQKQQLRLTKQKA